jgi:two-component system phosphate regulon sensor histidine kinase PhoR
MLPNAHIAWRHTLGRLALLLMLALALGFAIGRVWLALALAALGVLTWHYWKMRRLLSRLSARQRMPPRKGAGVWSELDRFLYRSQDETRGRHRRLLEMLRAYRAIAAALPDGIVLVDRNSQRIQWFNQAAGTLLGLQHPRDHDASLVERLQPLPIAHWLSGGRYADPMLDVASPNRPELRLSLRLIPYSEDVWLLVARDVSKLMRLEQMRRDFVANVSHELRTPLTVLHGYLEMLDPAEQSEWAPILTEMQRQSQRMTQLVEDLLTLSRLEAQDTLPEEHVAMTSMLAMLKREAEALSKQRHKIELVDTAEVDLWGSAKELHSAFSNLVSNAIRYTPAGGRITIRFARDGDGVALSVVDTGYGIPAEHLPRITERFYRVSSSRSRDSGGTGLGLSIVKHVLNLHQARLDVDSEVGRGSRFACHFGHERLLKRDNASQTLVSPTEDEGIVGSHEIAASQPGPLANDR